MGTVFKVATLFIRRCLFLLTFDWILQRAKCRPEPVRCWCCTLFRDSEENTPNLILLVLGATIWILLWASLAYPVNSACQSRILHAGILLSFRLSPDRIELCLPLLPGGTPSRANR